MIYDFIIIEMLTNCAQSSLVDNLFICLGKIENTYEEAAFLLITPLKQRLRNGEKLLKQDFFSEYHRLQRQSFLLFCPVRQCIILNNDTGACQSNIKYVLGFPIFR